jgi:hypothetical protein
MFASQVPQVDEVRVARPDFVASRDFDFYVQRPTAEEIGWFSVRIYRSYEQEQQYVDYRNIIINRSLLTSRAKIQQFFQQMESGNFLETRDLFGKFFAGFKGLITSSPESAALVMKILWFLACLNPRSDVSFEDIANKLRMHCYREFNASNPVITVLAFAEDFVERR